MKVFQKRPVAAIVMVLAIAAGILLGQARKPADTSGASTAIVGTYTYVYDHAGVLTDKTMEHVDAMNASLFAQTGAQIMVQTVDSTNGTDIVEYATELGGRYGVGSAGAEQWSCDRAGAEGCYPKRTGGKLRHCRR